MSTEKIERVNSDDITIFIHPNWYRLEFTGLVAIEEFRARYGIVASAQKAVDDNVVLLPEQPRVIMPPIVLTDDQTEEIYVRELRRRWALFGGDVIRDLKALIAREPAAFSDLLTSSILP